MKRVFVVLVVVIAAVLLRPHGHAQQVFLSADKDPVNNLPDPNRPYFDACGNKFDYQGNLIEKGTGCQPPAELPVTEFQGK